MIRDRGSASVELLALVPVVLLFAVLGLQLGVTMWAVTGANEAVRAGVRAQSLGQDGCAAARDTLTASLDVAACSASGGALGLGNQVRLVVDVPVLPPVAALAPDVQVTREAFLP